jgi:hypothetical protein
MRQVVATMLLLLGLGAIKPALAMDRGPVCREGSVVDEMARQVHAGNYYGRVDPSLITEQSTVDPNVVRCQVCVLSTPYNTTRAGERQIDQCLAHRFEIRIVARGFVVRDLR